MAFQLLSYPAPGIRLLDTSCNSRNTCLSKVDYLQHKRYLRRQALIILKRRLLVLILPIYW